MKRYGLTLTPSARAGVTEIVARIARDSPQNAERFVDRLLDSLDDVTAAPRAYAQTFPDLPGCDDVRRGLIRRQPNHAFYYFIEENDVVVFRVFDSRQDRLDRLARFPRTDAK